MRMLILILMQMLMLLLVLMLMLIMIDDKVTCTTLLNMKMDWYGTRYSL